MSHYPHEMRRRTERRKQRQPHTAEAARRALASDILARIEEELAVDPTVSELHTSPTIPIGPLETYLLRHQRKEIMAKIAINRTITAVFDEESTPPVLHITLEEKATDE